MTAKERYLEMVTELMSRRASAGELSDEEEARYSDELDRLWWEMSKSEQDEAGRIAWQRWKAWTLFANGGTDR